MDSALPSETINRRGMMLVLSSPSGAGKSTIARYILERVPGFDMSISLTTRQRRASEIKGVHYHFINEHEFEMRRNAGDLLEWAHVHGNYYGTPRQPVEDALAAGRDMLFDIDWQGAAQVREKMPEDIVSIFILPPSMKELLSRLQRRAEDPENVIAMRLENARSEIEQWHNYDYIIVNDDLDRAFGSIRCIIEAERLRKERRPGLGGYIDGLLHEEPS